MTKCLVCGAATRRHARTCAACGADLESHVPMNAPFGPDSIPVRRYGTVPPPAADGTQPAERPLRHTVRLLVLLVLGSLGAGAVALGVSRLLR